MNIPGHAGLTLAAVYGLGYLLDALSAQGQGGAEGPTPGLNRLWSRLQAVPRSVQRLGIDLRLVMVGAMLPDIIDKPLSFWLLREAVSYNTRNVAHSLVFNAVLLATALALLGLTRRTAPVGLSLGSLGHLLLDQMWHQPIILLWPFLGWRFPTGTSTLGEWFLAHLARELRSPAELAGALVLIWFAGQLYRRRAVLRFIRTGRTE